MAYFASWIGLDRIDRIGDIRSLSQPTTNYHHQFYCYVYFCIFFALNSWYNKKTQHRNLFLIIFYFIWIWMISIVIISRHRLLASFLMEAFLLFSPSFPGDNCNVRLVPSRPVRRPPSSRQTGKLCWAYVEKPTNDEIELMVLSIPRECEILRLRCYLDSSMV